MLWQVEVLNETVALELEALPKDMRAKYLRITALIREAGLHDIGLP